MPVGLDHDPVAQVVKDQGLLRLRQPDFPRGTGVFQGSEGGGPGSAVGPGNQDHVSTRLGDAGGDCAHPDLGHQLHVNTRGGVGVLQVKDQLFEVLDRVNIVVGRGRNQPDARGGVAFLRNPGVDLRGRQLPALARLRTLRHLDLNVAGVAQVVRGDAEPPRRHLLDRGVQQRVAQALRRLPALARIGTRPQRVHGDGHGFVGFLRDRPKRHGAGREAFNDFGDGFDFLQRDRLDLVESEPHDPPQGHEAPRLVVHAVRVCAENFAGLGACRDLEAGDRRRVEKVGLALAPPLVFPADAKRAVSGGNARGRVRDHVARGDLVRDHVDTDAAQG